MGRDEKAELEGQARCCERCGVELTREERAGGWTICDSCYAVRGSCCPEFGPDDLTGGDGHEGAKCCE